MGIGTVLARHTALRARANGFTLLTAREPPGALLPRFGFDARASHGDVVEHEVGFVRWPNPPG